VWVRWNGARRRSASWGTDAGLDGTRSGNGHFHFWFRGASDCRVDFTRGVLGFRRRWCGIIMAFSWYFSRRGFCRIRWLLGSFGAWFAGRDARLYGSRDGCRHRFGRFRQGLFGRLQDSVGELNDVALMNEPVQIGDDGRLFGSWL